MAAKFSLLSLCAVLATAPLGSCKYSEVIVGDGGTGLFGVPVEEYAGQEIANATGTVELDGYNLTIGVTADVRIANSSDTTMATVISLEMGQALRNRTTCLAIFHGLSANISAAAIDLTAQEGRGCTAMLTDECISGLMRASRDVLSENCRGYLPEIPYSCMDQFGDMSGSGFAVQHEDEQILYQYGPEPAAPGNDALWLAAATNIWPIFTTTMSDSTSSTFLTCLRPDTFKEGTVRPSAEPNGTGDPTGTGTTGGPTPSPTNAASHASLTIAAAAVGLIFNAAMLFM